MTPPDTAEAIPNFFDLGDSGPPSPPPSAPSDAEIAAAGTVEIPAVQPPPTPAPAATSAPPPPPAAAPIASNEALERALAMDQSRRVAEEQQRRNAEANQAWTSLLNPERKSMSREEREALAQDPEALLGYIDAREQHLLRVAQALHGAIGLTRQDLGNGLRMAVAQGAASALRAIDASDFVAGKLAEEGFTPEQVENALQRTDAALQGQPDTYPTYRTDRTGFEAAVRFTLASDNARPSGRPQPRVARISGVGYTPSTPASSSASQGASVNPAILASVERAMGIKIRPEVLARAGQR